MMKTSNNAKMVNIMIWFIPIILMLLLFRWRWKTAKMQPHPNALILIGALETLCDAQDYATNSDSPKDRETADTP